MLLPFQGVATFLKSTSDGKTPFWFGGLPCDVGSTFRAGSALAPNAVRAASMMLTDGEHPYFENDPCSLVTDVGDAALSSGSAERALGQIEQFVIRHIERGIPVLSGGNHLTTLGTLRALRRIHKQPLGLLHCDAHPDTWNGHFGERHGHGTFLRDAVSEGLVDATRVLSVGMRCPVDRETRDWLAGQGGTAIPMRDLECLSARQLASVALDRCRAREAPTFVTFDIDALDPSNAPGTGTPEAGGMTTAYARSVIENLASGRFIGMDVVEVNPLCDTAGVTALVAATLLYDFIAMMAENTAHA